MCRRDHILEDGKWCDGNPVSLFLSIWPQIPPSTLIWPEPGPGHSRTNTAEHAWSIEQRAGTNLTNYYLSFVFPPSLNSGPAPELQGCFLFKDENAWVWPQPRYTFSMNAPGIHSSLIDSHLNISTKHVGFYDMSIKQFTDLFLDKSCTLQTWKIVK